MFVLSLLPGFRCRFTPACGLSALRALLPPPFGLWFAALGPDCRRPSGFVAAAFRAVVCSPPWGCVLPPFQGLNVCFVPVTGVPLSLHPGLCSASPSGLLPPLLPGLLLLRACGVTLGSVVAAQLLADGGEQAVDVAGPDSQQNVKVKTFD